MTELTAEYFMRQAIIEGRKALPNCRPNPPVGCVIVKDGKIIARGHTNEPGSDHAEAMALKQVPNDIEGLELYVTLEPCSFYGRTPSCARNIASRQVKSVHVGMIDPHPKNRGAGIAILKNVNIEVIVGVLEAEIAADLSPYLTVA
ncbi:MAG: bifunctional diaminohydroxyphosphoribosylaminopyrimidine deaminase/5-amino-6-(5-phosphoribosylamino)uracil reductase RibD [Saprospiraceae bacterium]